MVTNLPKRNYPTIWMIFRGGIDLTGNKGAVQPQITRKSLNPSNFLIHCGSIEFKSIDATFSEIREVDYTIKKNKRIQVLKSAILAKN